MPSFPSDATCGNLLDMSFFGNPPPRVFGHRGAAALAPENTLPSFALALALGARYLELDVHGTLDGWVVVIHDSTVDRTTDGHGPVAAHTKEQLLKLDAGYWFTRDGKSYPYRGQGVVIPTLEMVLTTFQDCFFNVEIKQEHPPIVDAVMEVLDRTRTATKVLLAAERASIMKAIREAAAGRVATGMCAAEVAEFFDRLGREDWQGYRPAGRALQIPRRLGDVELVSERTIRAARRLGLEIHVWTVNEPDEIRYLLDLGVDGVMSDLPGLVAAAVAAREQGTQRT